MAEEPTAARQSFGEFRLLSVIEANAHLSAQRFSEVLLEEVRHGPLLRVKSSDPTTSPSSSSISTTSTSSTATLGVRVGEGQ